jgi:hypothetical protein
MGSVVTPSRVLSIRIGSASLGSPPVWGQRWVPRWGRTGTGILPAPPRRRRSETHSLPSSSASRYGVTSARPTPRLFHGQPPRGPDSPNEPDAIPRWPRARGRVLRDPSPGHLGHRWANRLEVTGLSPRATASRSSGSPSSTRPHCTDSSARSATPPGGVVGLSGQPPPEYGGWYGD